MSYPLALASSLAYGAADFLGGVASRRTSTVAVVVFSQLAGLVLVAAAYPLLGGAPTGADLVWGAGGGVAGGIGVGLLYHALSIGAMSVVAPVTAVVAIAVPVVAGLALGERPGAVAVAGVGLAAVAIALISREPAPDRPVLPGAIRAPGVAMALGAGLAIGVFYVALERTAPAAGLAPLVAARAASVALLAAFGLATRRAIRPTGGAWAMILAGGALDMLANVLYLLAVREGMLSVVAPLSSLYPGATVLLAWIVLGERLHWFQWLGVACAALAVAMITTG